MPNTWVNDLDYFKVYDYSEQDYTKRWKKFYFDVVAETIENTGNVQAVSYPENATFYIDNVTMGRTPKFIKGVKVGSHFFIFTMIGYREYYTNATVYENQTTYVIANMTCNS